MYVNVSVCVLVDVHVYVCAACKDGHSFVSRCGCEFGYNTCVSVCKCRCAHIRKGDVYVEVQDYLFMLQGTHLFTEPSPYRIICFLSSPLCPPHSHNFSSL